MPTTIDEVIEEAASKGIRWAELEYMDLLGTLRSTMTSLNLLALKKSGSFDASSVGLSVIEWSDYTLKPSPDTAIYLDKVVRLLCEIWEPFESRRSPKDPRYIVELLEEKLKGEGYRGLIGAELEFMTLDKDLNPISSPAAIPKANYHNASPSDPLYNFRLSSVEKLESVGFKVKSFHHEVGVGQSEISTESKSPLKAADDVVRIKRLLKEEGQKQGIIVTFMPKPIAHDNGSGMHLHLSLWDDSKNLFYDPDDEYAELSQLGRYFIGGLLEHIGSLAALVAPTVNSYKRLVPGFEAPVYAVWGRANRSAAVRVPVYRRGDRSGKRIEFRVPDPSANPYLAFAATFAAGLDGIKKKIDPGDPYDKNVYVNKPNVKRLPRSLHEALDELESDNSYLQGIMSKEALETYISLKRDEASRIGSYPSKLEYDSYLLI